MLSSENTASLNVKYDEDVPVSVLHGIEDSSDLQELEECKNMLIKESERCTEFATCLKSIAKKYEIDPEIIIKTILFYDLRPIIESNILENVWDF